MDNITTYAAINTKIKTMEAEFLKEEDYKNLLMQNSVAEVANYLKSKTSYIKVLENIETNTIHRGFLESIIKQNMIMNVDKILYYFNGNYKIFINTLYAKYEIEELKKIARAVYNGEDLKSYRNSVFIGKYSEIDINKIFEAKYIRDIISAFEGTEFYKYISPLIDNNIKENLFRFEMVLDLAYYNILQTEWKKLSKQDIEVLEHAQGLIADLLNIQWIYRGIKFYKLSPEVLLNYTIPLGYRIKKDFLKKLCYTESLDEFYKLAQTTRYGFMFKNDSTTDIFMERRMERYVYYELKSISRKKGMSIITVFNYVLFLEFEIRDIVAIIEAIRYKVPVEEAKKYLIKTLNEGV